VQQHCLHWLPGEHSGPVGGIRELHRSSVLPVPTGIFSPKTCATREAGEYKSECMDSDSDVCANTLKQNTAEVVLSTSSMDKFLNEIIIA
jgi:hypothetical protein